MRLAHVVGHVVSTQKNEKLIGAKLLLVQPEAADGTAVGHPIMAVDAAQAGIGERVLLVIEGRAAISALGRRGAPVDAAIVGVVDAALPSTRRLSVWSTGSTLSRSQASTPSTWPPPRGGDGQDEPGCLPRQRSSSPDAYRARSLTSSRWRAGSINMQSPATSKRRSCASGSRVRPVLAVS